MSKSQYITGYPTKPCGGGNPYYECVHCGVTDPEINGKLENHATHCKWRCEIESNRRHNEDYAKQRGYYARLDDEMSLNNPYRHDEETHAQANAWTKGWDEADTELEQEN